MDNQTLIDRVNEYQRVGYGHPLTCYRNSNDDLVAIEKDGQVVLECPGCGAIQDWVPDMFYDEDYQTWFDETRQYFEWIQSLARKGDSNAKGEEADT